MAGQHRARRRRRRKAKQHILDTFAAMISGSTLPPRSRGARVCRAYGGKEIATVVPPNCMCPIEALPNAFLAHSDQKPMTPRSPARSRACPSFRLHSRLAKQFCNQAERILFGPANSRLRSSGPHNMSMGAPPISLRIQHARTLQLSGRSSRGCAAAPMRANALIAGLHCAAKLQESALGSRDAEHMEKAFLFGETAGGRSWPLR